MITREEYLKAKAIVEQYEHEEYTQGTLDAMYCTECQAFNEQECFCDEQSINCEFCGELDGLHHHKCIYGDPLDYMNCGYG